MTRKTTNSLLAVGALLLMVPHHGSGQAQIREPDEGQLRRILLPAPTGPYAVGITRFVIADSSRPDTIMPELGDRRLSIWLWYPALRDSTVELHPYMDLPTARALAANQGIPEGFSERVVGHALDHPSPAPSPVGGWPVLLFSHGLSWPVSYYHTILGDQVSRGALVVAVEHTHGADPVVFPSGEIVPWGLFKDWGDDIGEDALREYLPTWRDDLLFVLSAVRDGGGIPEPASSILRASDLRAVGAFGHSYGGAAAILAAEASPEIVGAVNLDGSSWTGGSPYSVSAPSLYLISGVNEAEFSGNQWKSGEAFLLEGVVQGATHTAFSDLLTVFRHYSRTMGPRGRMHPNRAIAVTNELVARFFGDLRSGKSVGELAGGLAMSDVTVHVR